MTSVILSNNSTAESVLYKVNEFSKIGKEEESLDLLYAFIASKKVKNWSHDFEKLTMLNIDLAIKFKKMEMIEENLIIFKQISEVHNIESLMVIFKHYIETLEKEFNEIKNKVEDVQEIFEEMENQDDSQTFFFNSLDTKIGQGKELFKKQWRQLMQGYKTVLNLSFMNKNLVKIYTFFAKKLIDFLKQFKATQDFKYFYSLLKDQQKKLEQGSKHISMNLKLAEINKEFIDLRKYQIEASKELNLNQESFQILESLNYLLFSKKALNEHLLYYYTNLAEIFRKGGFHYFHVIALRQKFQRLIKMKVDQKLLQDEANRIILATLAVNTQSEEFFIPSTLIQKYQFLLPNNDLTINMHHLYETVENENILELCSKQIKNLFNAYSGKSDIYDFSQEIERGLSNLEKEDEFYSGLIKENSILIILKLISNYFTNISFENLKELTHFEDFKKVRAFISKNIFSKNIEIKINYIEKYIEFPQNQLTYQQVFEQKQSYFQKLQQVDKLLKLKLNKKKEENKKNLEENFNKYIEDYETLKSQKIENILEEQKIFERKKKVVESKISEEELQKIEKIKKEEEKQKEIERKMLGEKKKKIKELLQIKPDARVLDKFLSDYNDSEIVQISFDVLEKITEKINQSRQEQTKKLLDKRFNILDFFIRKDLDSYFQNVEKKAIENDMNLEEVKEEIKKIEYHEAENRKNFEFAENFLRVFKQEEEKKAKEIYETQKKEFEEKVKQEIGETIMKEVRALYEKHQKELKEQKQKRKGIIDQKNDPKNQQKFEFKVESGPIDKLQKGTKYQNTRKEQGEQKLEGKGKEFKRPIKQEQKSDQKPEIKLQKGERKIEQSQQKSEQKPEIKLQKGERKIEQPQQKSEQKPEIKLQKGERKIEQPQQNIEKKAEVKLQRGPKKEAPKQEVPKEETKEQPKLTRKKKDNQL